MYNRLQNNSFEASHFCSLMEIQSIIGNRIRELRLEKKLSQEALADLAEIDRTYITGVETGRRNVTVKVLHRIILALGTTYKEFYNHHSFNQN